MAWTTPGSKLENSWTIRWQFSLGVYPALISTVLGVLGIFTLKIESMSDDLPECLCDERKIN